MKRSKFGFKTSENRERWKMRRNKTKSRGNESDIYNGIWRRIIMHSLKAMAIAKT